MTDKQLFKLALDALIWTTGSGDFSEGGQAHDGAKKCLFPAIGALKERLAQPEQTEVQQLIALVREQQITIDKLEMALADHHMREVQRLGQEIEPVADDIASIIACRNMLDAQPVPPKVNK